MKEYAVFVTLVLCLSVSLLASCINPYQGDGASQSTPDASIVGRMDYQGPGQLYLYFFLKKENGTLYHVLDDHSYNGQSEHPIGPLERIPGKYVVVATTSRYAPDIKILNETGRANQLIAELVVPSGKVFWHRRLIYIGILHFRYMNNQLTYTVTDNFEEYSNEFLKSNQFRSGLALPHLQRAILTWK